MDISDETPIVSELLKEEPEMMDLVTLFLERLPGYLECLQDAQIAGDLGTIKKQAHDLKAVGGGYGFPQITELAVQLETAAAERRPEDVVVLVNLFSRLVSRIQAGAI
jgi:HPt (histidine-containing phosphotransfer) domain-containing protein